MTTFGRRKLLVALGGAAAWPLAARAQQSAMPVVGFLNSTSPGPYAHLVAAFRKGLSETGYVEGRNVAIEYRWAEEQYDRLPALAADLVRRQVAVIAACGGEPSVLAAKAATSTIPILFITGSDPVKLGIVASLNRPGGNATGVNILLQEMEGKRLGLMRELVPTGALIAVLLNPSNANFQTQLRDRYRCGAHRWPADPSIECKQRGGHSRRLHTLNKLQAAALLVGGDPFFNTRREQLVTLANHYAIPAIYEVREFAAAGGLMSYGTRLTEAYRQVGRYAGRILKGDKPGDLPVVQPTKFELVINLQTAKLLGLEVPPTLLARADEVIE